MITIHAGWWRCRIRSRLNPQCRWIYYHLTYRGSRLEFRREARYLAGQCLHRQVFDVEPVIAQPENLTACKKIGEVQFFYEAALADVPPIAAEAQE